MVGPGLGAGLRSMLSIGLIQSGIDGGRGRLPATFSGAGSLAPVAAMLSIDVLRAGFAFAAACRPSFAESVAAARRELSQGELSASVAGAHRGPPTTQEPGSTSTR